MTRTRRPAGDLIQAILDNMRANLEELRYATVAPSRYAVYLSPAEHARLEGLLPRLEAEAIRALNEELARLNRRSRLRRSVGRWFGPGRPPLEIADTHWQVEFLPDMDGELAGDQDILVQSELVLPRAPELGAGERTRRVTTVRGESETTTREEIVEARPTVATGVLARLSYTDDRGPHVADILGDSTTIGRGGAKYPVTVRVATSDDISREHARIRRDPATGMFFVVDLSVHGTTVDGRAVPRGYTEGEAGRQPNGAESPLGRRARIGLAGRVFLEFEQVP